MLPTADASLDPVARRLARLADDQRAAATAAPGPVLCVAPAGSGKTTTVVARLAWRVAGGTDPSTICALTFNRAAAQELQERADAALGELGHPAASVRVRTFHALGREILADAGIDVTRIADRSALLEEAAAGALTVADQRSLDEAFTRLKLDPERGPPAEEVETHRAFAAYQDRLRHDGAIDLDDLVALAGPTLREDRALLGRWRRRASVLFVDEAQDLDKAQLDLALLLAGDRRDIFLVGDDDQTIYAWRLADVRRVLGLADRLPGLRRVDLQTNHRCAPQIVQRAARLVSHNDERFAKEIRSSPRASGWLTLAPDPGDDVARARRLLSTWFGREAGSHAVLGRTNRELLPYAAVAREMSLDCDIAAEGLLLGDTWLAPIVEAARTIEREGGAPLLLALRDAAVGLDAPAEITAAVLAWAAAFDGVEAFATALAERSAPSNPEGAHGSDLTLATVHGTKGLEWDHVACIGFDDGAFPSARTLEEASEPARALEEERRLAYVAWTRARSTLTIVYDPWAPSLFLREAFDPDELA